MIKQITIAKKGRTNMPAQVDGCCHDRSCIKQSVDNSLTDIYLHFNLENISKSSKLHFLFPMILLDKPKRRHITRFVFCVAFPECHFINH